MDQPSVILFDGVCNLCNGAVQFIIKHDKKKQFVFASLQSAEANTILKDLHFSADGNSFILIERNIIYQRSTAALRVAKKLDGLLSFLYAFIIVPKFIRDGVYNFIAINRYKWFGKKNECMIPTQELKSRFLSYTL